MVKSRLLPQFCLAILTPAAGFATGAVFEAVRSYDVGQSPLPVVAADFNGDELPDRAVANSGSNSLSVLMNTGEATFVPNVDYPTGKAPLAVFAADFDG